MKGVIPLPYTHFADAVLTTLTDGVITIDPTSTIVSTNPAVADIFGYEEGSLIGKNLSILMPASYRASHGHHIRHFTEEPVHRIMGKGRVIEGLHASGEVLYLEVGISKVHIEEGFFLVALVKDITTRKKNEDTLRYLAFHDILTGLINRSSIQERIQQSIARATRYNRLGAVLYIDLDHFKPINDQWGHHMGDHVLKSIASRLQHACREHDSVGRMGGDEFVMLLDEISSEQDIYTVVSRVQKTCEEPIEIENHVFKVSCSIGFTCFPREGTSAHELIHTADTRMLAIKQQP